MKLIAALGAGLLVLLLVVAAGLWIFSTLKARQLEAANPPRGQFMPVPGGRLHYTERTPQGPARGTVVLLHGASGNQADLMLSLGDRLAALGFRVIAPDRPGHGWSSRPDGPADASPARQAVLIRDGLRAIGVSHAIVLGHSWSGALAVDFALDQPDFTDGIVLVSPVTHPWSTGLDWYYGWAASPTVGPAFNALLTMPVGLYLLPRALQGVFAPEAPPPGYNEAVGVAMVLRPAEFTANAQDMNALLPFVTAQAPRMGAIRVPTAIVAGADDRMVRSAANAEASARVIPGARLTLLPGVGHSPPWARPEAVVAAVVDVADRARAQAAQR